MLGARSAAAAVVLLGLAALPAMAASLQSYDELPEDRVLYVAPGQSLSALIPRLYPDRRQEWGDIQRWIVEHNPGAFIDGDPSKLRADVRVRLPHPSELARRQTEERTATAPAQAQSDAPQAAAAEVTFGRRYLFVDPAQSLRDLVPKIYPSARDRWDEIIDAIMVRNADVFADGTDPDETIGRGTRLQIPEAPQPRRAAADSGEEKPLPPPEDPVARVVALSGEMVATGRYGRERHLSIEAPVRRHDLLQTGPDARAELRFHDDERVFLRPETRLRIRGWRLPDVGPGKRVFQLVAGGLRAITGAIGNRAEDDYRTITPNATMGVRGTDYALRVCGEGDCRMGSDAAAAVPPGLYVGVAKGRVFVLNGAGDVDYSAGHFGYVAGPDSAPESVGEEVSPVLFTSAEREAMASAAPAEKQAESDDDGPSLWLIVGGLLLLGAAL